MKKRLMILSLILVLVFSIASPAVLGASKSSPTIAQLQKKITELTKQIKTLNTNLSKKAQEIKTLKNNISKKTEENTVLKNEVKTLSMDLGKSNNENASLKYQVTEKDKQLSEQQSKVEDLTKVNQELTKKANLLTQVSEIIYTDSNVNPVSKGTNGAIKWYGFKKDMTTIYLTPNAFEQFYFIIGTSDQALKEIASYFGTTKLSRDIPVYIWLNDPITVKSYGEYLAREKRILINGIVHEKYNQYNRGNFTKTYIHEFAHAFQDVTLNLNPIRDRFRSDMMWLNEGMADYIVQQYVEYRQYTLPDHQTPLHYKFGKETYTEFINGSLQESKATINDMTNVPNDTRYSGYIIYESMIYYIENKYGHKKFFEFIEGLRIQSISDSMEKNFGVTEEQFIKDWKKYFSL